MRRLGGWGRATSSVCRVIAVHSAAEAAAALADAPTRGALARGLGRSYGDLAQNGGGTVLDMTGLDSVCELDAAAGRVVVDAGVTLATLAARLLPHGWFLPVTPGTKHVTVGGAIACDVHGKNHHRDGSFGRYVRALTLLKPDGDVVVLDREHAPEEFAATVGGLGLTGVIIDATLEVVPIETGWMVVDIERSLDIDETLDRLSAIDYRYQYSVAWLDCRAQGSRLGRSVLFHGEHARASDVVSIRGTADAPARAKRAIGVPRWASVAPFIRGLGGAAFNELYFSRARPQNGALQSLDSFFYPLDALDQWNRLYGYAGFLQYQFVVPAECKREVVEVVRLLSSKRPAPALAVMKRMGPGEGPLSFPIPGWTVSLDIPLPAAEVAPLLDRADELVAGAGGRVYFAKDARLRPELVRAMYPQLEGWRETQARLDPHGRMQGDLARRLHLTRPA